MAIAAEKTLIEEPTVRPQGFLVKERIDGAHPRLKDYYLLPEDLLVRDSNGTYSKVCPGMGVGGFELTAEQEAKLTSVEYISSGLNYQIFEPTEEG